RDAADNGRGGGQFRGCAAPRGGGPGRRRNLRARDDGEGRQTRLNGEQSHRHRLTSKSVPLRRTAAMTNLEELLHHLLKDIYYAEKQIVKALRKMAKATENPELKDAFEHHLEETKAQVG